MVDKPETYEIKLGPGAGKLYIPDDVEKLHVVMKAGTADEDGFIKIRFDLPLSKEGRPSR